MTTEQKPIPQKPDGMSDEAFNELLAIQKKFADREAAMNVGRKSPEEEAKAANDILKRSSERRVNESFDRFLESKRDYHNASLKMSELERKYGITGNESKDQLARIYDANPELKEALTSLNHQTLVYNERTENLGRALDDARKKGIDVSEIEQKLAGFNNNNEFKLKSHPLQKADEEHEKMLHRLAAGLMRMIKGVLRSLGIGPKEKEAENQAKQPEIPQSSTPKGLGD